MSLNYLIYRNEIFKITKFLINNDLRYLTSFNSIRTFSNDSKRTTRNDLKKNVRLNRSKLNSINQSNDEFSQMGRQDYELIDRIMRREDDNFKDDKNLSKSDRFSRKMIDKLSLYWKLTTNSRKSELFYCRLDGMNSNDFKLAYANNEMKIARLIGWFVILSYPFLFVFLIYRYLNNDLATNFFDDDRDEMEPFQLYHMLIIISVYCFMSTIVYLNLTRLVIRIYFNEKTRKFILIHNRTPFLKKQKKKEIDLNKVIYEEPKYLLKNVIRLNFKMPDGERMIIDPDKFTKPIYQNLLLGYSKGRKLDY